MTNNKSISALEIRTSIVFNLSFPKNPILSCLFSFFFILIDSYVLILAVIAQSFIPTAKLVIPTKHKLIKQVQKLKHNQ